MKKSVAVLVAVLCLWGLSVPALAYSRSGDAVVYSDFNTENGTINETGAITCESGVIYLNGKGDNTAVSMVDGAAKIEMESGGFVVFGQDAVQFRDASGKLKYQYLVIRMKGESGNENRSEIGGLLLFIGGGDGEHAITLNDRPTGSAPAAQDANGKPMNAISTEWQEFVIALTDSNVRKAENGKAITGLNINTVSVPATLYIDDIYLTNSAPKTAAVYDPATGTAALTEENKEPTEDGAKQENGNADKSGEQAENKESAAADVVMLEPPVSTRNASPAAASSNMGLILFVVGCAVVLVMAVLFSVIYFAVIKRKLK